MSTPPARATERRFKVIEGGERLGDRANQLGKERRLDLIAWHERHHVLQFGQLAEVRGRQQVGAGGEDLAELDEGRPQFLERDADVLGTGVRRRVARVAEQTPLEGNMALVAEKPHEVTQSVACQDPGDLTIAVYVGLRRLARHMLSFLTSVWPGVRRLPTDSASGTR
ncbi:MAG: hypothetical protein ABI369_15720 [Acetobacteraceae bacterium]